ncbi:hypothetical protein AWJ14_14835 [Hoeflea olei]|uniref:Uncharacterized protein n=1 Tax=Hoeflea olei TaxID=1480615 RepID=A0A1C1YQH9_9HYPH|nr:hypothetical protein AWJ14_14835 [Hoeflea olei]
MERSSDPAGNREVRSEPGTKDDPAGDLAQGRAMGMLVPCGAGSARIMSARPDIERSAQAFFRPWTEPFRRTGVLLAMFKRRLSR